MTSESQSPNLTKSIEQSVSVALSEDVGDGDITAQLIPADRTAKARVITREAGVMCGSDWVNEVFTQLDKTLNIQWHKRDGDTVNPNDCLFELDGLARPILTGERAALNFLQTLSGTATRSHHYASLVKHTSVTLLDTRKTIPGMRLAQKYAVKCGGCSNHRIGLFDAFLIKENHIMACGSIAAAVGRAREIAPGKPVEVEVESLAELQQALDAGADIIMLDNFSLPDLQTAVQTSGGKAKLEASGGITDQTLVPIAETGVDYISLGTLTKDCKAMDLSMRITM